MTGVLNHASFTDRLDLALRRRDGGDSLSVVFLDVDDFKAINDLRMDMKPVTSFSKRGKLITGLCRETESGKAGGR